MYLRIWNNNIKNNTFIKNKIVVKSPFTYSPWQPLNCNFLVTISAFLYISDRCASLENIYIALVKTRLNIKFNSRETSRWQPWHQINRAKRRTYTVQYFWIFFWHISVFGHFLEPLTGRHFLGFFSYPSHPYKLNRVLSLLRAIIRISEKYTCIVDTKS